MKRSARARLLLTAAIVVALGSAGALAPNAATASDSTNIGHWDWRTYGHDATHSFHGVTTLHSNNVASLAPAWSFSTGKAVTATPTVVAGRVYVGSWDGYFYALDLRTGALRWKFQLDAQPAISPLPDGPNDAGSDGGMVVSSAWFEPGRAGRPDLVIFGGGYTLYALVARTGTLYWKHVYSGRPELPADPTTDGARIFSSPVVADGRVIIGLSVDGQRGERGAIVASDVGSGKQVWRLDTDVDTGGTILNDGCGNVWSSATLLPRSHVVVFDVADCHFRDPLRYSETVLALRVANGTPVWVFHPPRRDDGCDFDFGATANAGVDPRTNARFLGVGSKDGTYYSLNPSTGALRWRTNVVFGGLSGGFIGTTAYDGRHVYGSTSLGDFGRFEGQGDPVCDPNDPRDTPRQEPTAHAFDATTGAVMWQASDVASFGPTTVAGGMTFNCLALAPKLVVRDTSSGAALASLPLRTECWSGIATVGNALVLGTGASFSNTGNGVTVLTPNGTAPVIPVH